jgi:hypothetical protein
MECFYLHKSTRFMRMWKSFRTEGCWSLAVTLTAKGGVVAAREGSSFIFAAGPGKGVSPEGYT